jgi:hypothetical protein
MFRPILLISLLCITPIARAAESTWSLTTADFNKTAVTVSSLDDKKLTATERGDHPVTIPVDYLLRLDREAAPAQAPAAPRFTLWLGNGDKLTGDLGDLKEDTIAWTSPVLGAFKVPLDGIRAITRSPNPTNLDAERKEDQVLLTNHDVVRGVVAGIEGGKVLVQPAAGGDPSPVPLASMDAILLATAKPPADANRAFRVRFVDGSQFTSRSLAIKGNTITVSLPGAGGATHDVDAANVASIEQVNGPVRWLSDQPPQSAEQTPFNSDTTFPARFDRNVFGKPLRVGSQTFEKGIGVHANSKLVFALEGPYKTFRTRYGIDTSADASRADVNVRILLDDKVVHEQQHVRAYAAAPLVTVPLGSAKTLTLEVTAAGPTDTQDRLDWLEPALVRDLPPLPPPSAPPSRGPPTSAPATTTASTAPSTAPSTRPAAAK